MQISENQKNNKLTQKVYSNQLLRIAYSTAACSYKIIPDIVLFPTNEMEIIEAFEFAKSESTNMTFRGGGTSLSGQSIGEGVICNLTKDWSDFEIIDNGLFLRCKPGLVAGRANEALKYFNRRIGPDPASINAATIGGILANNSSGMMSGINQSAYHSFESMRIILSSGTIIDSAESDANEQLKLKEPNIYKEILAIKDIFNSSEHIYTKIKKEYELKNTIGYQMNAFIDFEKPIDILTHLLVGSEGTLGFISSVVLKTYPIFKHRITGLALFNTFSDAAKAIPFIKKLNPQSVEIIDINSLKSVYYLPDLPEILKNIQDDNTALLFDFASNLDEEILNFKLQFEQTAKNFTNMNDYIFESNEYIQEKIWKIRKGLLPSIGKSRPIGTGVIIEDLCFRIEDFPDAVADLRLLLNKFAYHNVSIYGHGLDGNIHFLLNQSFENYSEIEKYGKFMDELAVLVVDKYNASLKAEHSTGRNQAPYVEKLWGTEIYQLMKRIKNVFDPENILNRDVIFSNDKQIHLKNLKIMPETDFIIDSCIECGFCEPVCPTRFATLTPRQRISILRHLKLLDKNSDEYKNLLNDYQYYSIDTCATDGMCQIACPVGINTGDLIKQFRNNSHKKSSIDISLFLAEKFNIIENLVNPANSMLHTLNKLVPDNKIESAFNFLGNQLQSSGISIQRWNHNLGKKSAIEYSNSTTNADYIYFPVCVTRMMGQSADDSTDLHKTVLTLAKKAAIKVVIPDSLKNLCCGQVFSSKGFEEAGESSQIKLLDELYLASDKGRIPIIISSSSCSYNILKDSEKFSNKYSDLKLIELTEWAYNLLDKLQFINCKRKIMLHINCSIEKLGLRGKLIEIAKTIAQDVYIPVHSTCCGSAGDRSLLYPEITDSSMFQVKKEISDLNIKDCYSANLTCEFSISNYLGIDCKSILFLMDECAI